MPIPPLLLTVEYLYGISDERNLQPLQKNKAIFSKNYFSNILDQILEKLHIYIIMPTSPSLLTVE